MGRFRARFALLTLLVASVVMFIVHGQAPAPSGIVVNVGLPAVEQHITAVDLRTAGSAQGAARAAFRDSLQRARAGGDTDYVPGRVIVKFRDRASIGDRAGALRNALGEPSAFIAQRPEHANFDIVRIDTDDDAETAAESLGGEDAVEYAQAAYRVHANFSPNDPNYVKG